MNYREKLYSLGIKLNNTGRQVCPKCSEGRKNKTERCLVVTYESDSVKYHCHHCQDKGVVSYAENINIYKAPKVYKRPEPVKPKENKKPIYTYATNKRGISDSTIDTYGIYQDEKGNIVFPYYKNNELVNNKTRVVNKETGIKSFFQTAESEQTLYGMDVIPNDCKKLIWVEGEWDVLSFYEIGEYAVSPNQGGTDKKLDCFENCFDFINSFDEHIIAVDNDEVGNQLRENLKERLKHKLVKIVDWGVYGEPNKDANDFVARGEKEVLIDALQNAKEIKNSTIETFADQKEYILDIFKGKRQNLYSTGWANLDKLFKIQTGRLMVVSGTSKNGKSFFVDNMLFNLTHNEQWKHLVCSFEGDMYDQLKTLAEFRTGQSMNQGVIGCMDESQVEDNINYFSNYFLRLKTDKLYSIDDIIEQAKYCVMRYGIKTITIDPYNKLKQATGDREDKHIEDILSKMILFARQYNVLVIFVAHPRHRVTDDVRPTLATISGGGAWHSMADYGIIVHRERIEDTLSNVSEIFVEKVKSRTLGNPNGGCEYLEYSFNNYKLNPTTKPIKEKGVKKWE